MMESVRETYGAPIEKVQQDGNDSKPEEVILKEAADLRAKGKLGESCPSNIFLQRWSRSQGTEEEEHETISQMSSYIAQKEASTTGTTDSGSGSSRRWNHTNPEKLLEVT
jgi:hypothetical protein